MEDMKPDKIENQLPEWLRDRIVSSTCSVIKRFGIDFTSDGGALTLYPEEVTDTGAESGTHTRTHSDGWTITGDIIEDYHVWVKSFKATHPELGTVEGDFEDEVKATSEDAFAHFYENHKPNEWDYEDI
jgi:hypothetical protein